MEVKGFPKDKLNERLDYMLDLVGLKDTANLYPNQVSASMVQRITVARADQAIFTWISATKITGDPPLSITLPDAPGVYEIRLLDVSNQAVLTRKVVKVE